MLQTENKRTKKGQTDDMKRSRYIRFYAIAIAVAVLFAAVSFCVSASGSKDSSVDPNALITYGYLQSILEDLKLEILAEVAESVQNGEISVPTDTPDDGNITVGSSYTDVTFPSGTVIVLGSDAEAIFRGGDAVIISVSQSEGNGIFDLSAGKECFSGEMLSFGHIYYKPNTKSRAYILVTGDKAAFTMRGTYETR